MAVFSFLPKQQLVVTGKILGAEDGQKVLLMYSDISSDIIDSAIIKNGKFTIKTALESPRMLAVVLKNEAKRYSDAGMNIFADKGTVEVMVNKDDLMGDYERAGTGALVSNAKVSGSSLHNWYAKFYSTKRVMDMERDSFFMKVYIPYLNPGKGKEKGPKEIGMNACRSIDDVSARRTAFMMEEVLKNKPSENLAFIALLCVNQSNITTDEIAILEKHFAAQKDQGAISKGFFEKAELVKKTAIGAQLLDFVLQDKSGKEHALSEYVGKGKYVLLEFWASWCGPCRADIPHLKEAFDAYNPKGFEVVSVSLDEKKEDWLIAVGEEKLNGTWPQLIENNAFNSELTKQYRIRGIPSCLLFDPSGKLVSRNMRGSWMDMILIEKYGGDFFTKN